MLNDQERICDFLSSEKKMSTNYDTYASECVSIPLRDDFLRMLNHSHQTQTQLFQIAQSRGWYQVDQAPANQISQTYAKFNNQRPQSS